MCVQLVEEQAVYRKRAPRRVSWVIINRQMDGQQQDTIGRLKARLHSMALLSLLSVILCCMMNDDAPSRLYGKRDFLSIKASRHIATLVLLRLLYILSEGTNTMSNSGILCYMLFFYLYAFRIIE